jgi:hypothetical protein
MRSGSKSSIARFRSTRQEEDSHVKRITTLGAAAFALMLGFSAVPVARAEQPTPPTDAQKQQMQEKMKAQHEKDVEAQKAKVQEQHQKDVQAQQEKVKAQHAADVDANTAKMKQMKQDSDAANLEKLKAEQQAENAKKVEDMKAKTPPAPEE